MRHDPLKLELQLHALRRRWLKQRSGGAPSTLAPPKGVTLFGDPAAANTTDEDECVVVHPLRLMALRGRGEETLERVKSALRHEIK